MRKLSLILTAILGIIIGALLCVEADGVGSKAFSITIQSSSPSPIVKVQCWPCQLNEEWIEGIERGQMHCCSPNQGITSPFTGQVILVDVKFTCRKALLPARRSYEQETHLFVEAIYQDGKQVRKVMKLPDGRTKKSLTVPLP